MDSLKGAHPGNENSSEMLEIISRLAGLARDFDVSLLIVHHLRKLNMIDQKSHTKVTLPTIPKGKEWMLLRLTYAGTCRCFVTAKLCRPVLGTSRLPKSPPK